MSARSSTDEFESTLKTNGNLKKKSASDTNTFDLFFKNNNVEIIDNNGNNSEINYKMISPAKGKLTSVFPLN